MRNHAGFTLIETVMTTLILVTGLASVAGAFVYGIQTSVRTRQQTTAFALLAEKMEILRASDARSPGMFSEYFGRQDSFLTTWEISSDLPQRITVIVSGRQPGAGKTYKELARASTLVGSQF